MQVRGSTYKDKYEIKTFFHELGVHAGRILEQKPNVHDVKEVDDLGVEIEKYFNPPAKDARP